MTIGDFEVPKIALVYIAIAIAVAIIGVASNYLIFHNSHPSILLVTATIDCALGFLLRYHLREPIDDDPPSPVPLEFRVKTKSGTEVRIFVLFRIRQSQNNPIKVQNMYHEVHASLSIFYGDIDSGTIPIITREQLNPAIESGIAAAEELYAISSPGFTITEIANPGTQAGDIYA